MYEPIVWKKQEEPDEIDEMIKEIKSTVEDKLPPH